MTSRLFRKPFGLVLAGGGAHGAWQAAVVERLHNQYGLKFDHVLCFSIGALTGTAYCLNRMEKLIAIWKNVSGHKVLRLRPRLFPFSVYSSGAIWDFMRHVGSEEEAQRKARCNLTTMSYCVETRKHRYSRFSPGGYEGWDGPMTARLVASCSIPRVFPPVQIRDQRCLRTYIDGGVKGEDGFNFSALRDCRDILVLQMARPDEVGRKPSLGLFSRKLQCAREGLQEAITTGLMPLQRLKPRPRIFRFYPTRRLDYSALDFTSRRCIPALYHGAHDADCLMIDPSTYLLPDVG
ncbi:MAG: patatin-like phospholipase family protein [Elusimicrobiota bacterium]